MSHPADGHKSLTKCRCHHPPGRARRVRVRAPSGQLLIGYRRIDPTPTLPVRNKRGNRK